MKVASKLDFFFFIRTHIVSWVLISETKCKKIWKRSSESFKICDISFVAVTVGDFIQQIQIISTIEMKLEKKTRSAEAIFTEASHPVRGIAFTRKYIKTADTL